MEKRSSSVFRIDERVFITMGVIALISLVILGFRYRYNEPCHEIVLKMNAANYYTNTVISFKAETINGRSYEWYFGDGSKPESGGSLSTHEFRNPGRYTVNLRVNGKCEQVINVDVQDAPIYVNPDLIPRIKGPDTALINVPVSFTDLTPDATSWEWRFGNSEVVESNTRNASYTFTTEGHHEVYLRINGRPDRYTKVDVFVKDPAYPKGNNTRAATDRKFTPPPILPPIKVRPDAPPLDQGGPAAKDTKEEVKPEAKPHVVRDIKPDEISDMLEQVVSGKKSAGDFAEFLCSDLDIPVKYNNQNMSFGRMCNELKAIKKTKKINKPVVILGKDKSTNCIKSMDVTVSKKGFLDTLF